MPAFIDGNQAIATAAVDAGCDFFAGYPITPATQILLHLADALPKVGGLVIQGEDEIASLGFCIGAAMSGRRAMTATSGPGISLYSENIGLAIMGEVPLVIVDVQRMGPATGAATTGSQGDVQFLRWGTSGGYPVVVLSPSTVAECYTLTIQAFELAEKLRTPVFLATDKETAQTRTSVELKRDQQVAASRKYAPPGGKYQPLGIKREEEIPDFTPFGGEHTLRFTTSSHDQDGYLTKDPAALDFLNRHLYQKIESRRDELELVELDLEDGADDLILSYGITARSARAAAEKLRANGKNISLCTVYSLWPVPKNSIQRAMQGVRRVILPELNFGQYAREIERLSCGKVEIIPINRVDGKLISPDQILEEGGLR